jgi:non-ribosomal peptide synthetase component F/acyl carrier protein
MWLFDRLLTASVSCEAPVAARLRGPLNLAALDAAIGFVHARHEGMRTRFPCFDDVPWQVIDGYVPVRVGLVDFSGLSRAERELELASVAARVSAKPFDLAAGPLSRTVVVRLGHDDHVVLWCVHHLAADLWSMDLMASEFSAGYQRAGQGVPPRFPPLTCQPAELGIRQRSRLTPGRMQRQRRYWRDHLAGSSCVPLPADHPRPPLPGLGSRVHQASLDPGLSDGLRRLSREQGVTLFAVLLGALGALVHRWTGHDDLVVVSVTAGRRSRAAEQVVGMLTECLVVRINMAGDPGFTELVARAGAAALDAFDHSSLPFAEIVGQIDPGRELEPSPLRQVGLSLSNTPRSQPPVTGLRIEAIPESPAELGISEADLWLDVFDNGVSPLAVRLQLDDRLFEPESLRLTMQRFTTLLRCVVARPATRLSGLPLLGEEERCSQDRWGRGELAWGGACAGGDPVPDSPRAGTLSGWLDEVRRREPDKIAITCAATQLTYRALAVCVERLAQRLHSAGIGQGDLVYVRSRDPVAGLAGGLAVARAGAIMAWSAHDAAIPGEAGLPAALQLGLGPVMRERAAGGPAQAELEFCPSPGLARTGPLAAVPPDHLSCFVTCGGRLVGYPNRMLRAMATMTARRLGGLACGRVLVCAQPGWSVYPAELLVLLMAGCQLVLGTTPGDGSPGNPDDTDGPGRAGCPVMLVPSGLAESWMSAGWRAPRTTVIMTDSGLPAAAARALANAGTPAWIRYAPAGVPGWVAMSPVRLPADAERGRLVYGRPLGVPQVRVLDQELRPALTGTEGGVCLGGDVLPWGFVSQPGETARSFVPDPEGSGRRLWLTGERARFRWDGILEPATSCDSCFEVAGYWVNPAEVERCIAGHPGVAEAAVRLLSLTADGGVLVPAVVAFVVPATEPCPSAEEILRFAAARLPWYAVPAVLARVGAIPRRADGTPDRRLLPSPDAVLPAGKRMPGTPTAVAVADLFRALLGTGPVYHDDNFFRLGGTSMDAVRLSSAIRRRFGVDVPLYELMTAPTTAGVAEAVEAARARRPVTE